MGINNGKGENAMRRTLVHAALAAGLVGIWMGTSLAAPPIKLGAHAPQTGSLAKHGAEQIKGIRLAVEEFEKQHKVKVDLLVYDDESNPPKAVAAVEKLAGVDKVNGIVGGYGSNLVGPASEASERYDTPYLTTGAVDTKLSAKKFRNFFRLNNMPGYAIAQSGTIRDLFKAKKVAILYNSLAATTEIAGVVKDQLVKDGVSVPVFEKFEKGTTNYKPILLKVKDAGCDVLLVEGYFPDYVGTIKDAKILNLPVKAYVGAWGIGTPEFTRELGPMSEYVYGTSIWEMGTAPKAAKQEEAQMVAAYKAKFKEEPSYIAMLGYLSGKYMLEAIYKGGDKTGSYNAEKTRQVLRAMDTMSPLGRVAFDEKGDPKHFSAVLFQTQKGSQVVVYPQARAQGSIVYPAVPWGGK
ncbi:MAG TPA: amino acid ABC transporter substrate-binding protein [Candidatus Deferrimicrobiaceae bacterium]|nr:amino acid ABC transporter substrate-binding protein [Candidatus Deferrimicrobiaceae bacterium]